MKFSSEPGVISRYVIGYLAEVSGLICLIPYFVDNGLYLLQSLFVFLVLSLLLQRNLPTLSQVKR